MKKALEFLGAGVLVYGLVAACSGGEGAQPPQAAAGSGGSTGVIGSGGGGSGVDSATDALIDALVDPVGEAEAQTPSQPVVITSPCNIEVPYAAGASLWFAEVSFPGRTLNELSRLSAYANYPGQLPTGAPAGYRSQVLLPVIQLGKAAVACGSGTTASNTVKAESVTFVLP